MAKQPSPRGLKCLGKAGDGTNGIALRAWMARRAHPTPAAGLPCSNFRLCLQIFDWVRHPFWEVMGCCSPTRLLGGG